MSEIIINVYYLAIVGGIVVITVVFMFLLHSFGGIRLFVRRDECLAARLIDKFPLTTSEFIHKPLREQNVENNQEIHELNKRLDKMQYYLDKLNVHQAMTLDEVKKG